MFDPFAAANAVLFRSSRSVAAIYTPVDDAPLPGIRVIRLQGTEEAAYGQGSVLIETDAVQVQRADIEQPRHGDELAIGDNFFIIQGDPKLDRMGLNWLCRLEPAP